MIKKYTFTRFLLLVLFSASVSITPSFSMERKEEQNMRIEFPRDEEKSYNNEKLIITSISTLSLFVVVGGIVTFLVLTNRKPKESKVKAS